MKHVYFVRHGLSVMNQQGIFSGRTDTPLTRDGVEQSHEAGRQLREAGIDCIVSSPIERARHTAEIIADEIGFDQSKIILDDNFIELDFGPLEGADYSPDTDLDNIEGVEHSDELIARVSKGLEFLRALEADTILVVSHGATGRALRHLIDPAIPYAGSPKFENGQVVKLL